ncbi:MAG: Asp23/Gls24 family envelope stress response protein [Clostridia bacterium]|nr:Asp23/Gls24 family envelope stress response protein [Clostridia bacterium]
MAVEETNINTTIDRDGNVCISNDVVATIASIAAKSIDGVAGMFGSITGGFAELLGKKNPSKGVKVAITDREVKIDMFVIVEYGVKIPDVAWEIQEKTKNEVEAMTGLNVVAVNVNIEGVNTAKKEEPSEEPTQEMAEETTEE